MPDGLRLLLVRHGETDWNRDKRYLGSSDFELNETGLCQAEALASFLQTESIDIIYASGLSRATQTAAAIGKPHGLTPQADDRLRELSLGVFEGLTFVEANQRYPEMMSTWLEDYEQPPQDGESLSALRRRTAEFITMLRQHPAPASIAIVSHGGPLREIVRQLLGLPESAHWYFSFSPASLSEILLYSGELVVKYLNQTSHLIE